MRTNHVHLAARPGTGKELMLAVFKARSTRILRETGCTLADQPLWSEHGSTRILFSTRAVTGAAFYVRRVKTKRSRLMRTAGSITPHKRRWSCNGSKAFKGPER